MNHKPVTALKIRRSLWAETLNYSVFSNMGFEPFFLKNEFGFVYWGEISGQTIVLSY